MICEETYATAWRKMAAEEGHAKRLPEQTGKPTGAPTLRAERIRALFIQEGPMTMADIAARLGLTKCMTTDALERGVAAGMFASVGTTRRGKGWATVWSVKGDA